MGSIFFQVLKILIDSNEDRLFVVYNNGFSIIFDAFSMLHIMYHEATACHVTGEIVDLISIFADLVKAVVEKFGTSAAKEDMEGMMSVFSDSFEHYQYGDKAGVKEFLQQSADMGYLEGIEFSMEDAEFEKDGETISVYPVDVEGSFGSITFEYVLKKEGDAWKIVEFDASGL